MGETLYWGGFGRENYVAELYDENDNFITQISFGSTKHQETGNTVAGVGGASVSEYIYSWKAEQANASYVRILGNISTKESFRVHKNLPNGFSDFTGKKDPVYEPVTDNMFDPASSENWDKALTYYGKRLDNATSYANIFTTHPIAVNKGETVYWGGFGSENYVAEAYTKDGTFIKQISFYETDHKATGQKVNGVGGNLNQEYIYSWTADESNIGYLRILGNLSTKQDFQVYKNLPNGFADFPMKGAVDVNEMDSFVLDGMPYRLYVPENNSAEKPAPVIVFLHGAGERGTDNEAQLANAIQPFFSSQEHAKDAIVIAPQCPEDKRWVETDWEQGSYDSRSVENDQLDKVLKILEKVEKENYVDTDRVYAAGLSMGGIGTWNLLMNHSDIFSAGIAVCGAADPARAEEINEVPVWAFHGDKDTTVPYAASVEMTDALKEAGSSQVRFTTYTGQAHGIWNTAFSTDGLADWLFSNRLSDRTGYRNLFDAESADNWTGGLYEGSKTEDSSSFVTHKMAVRLNDTLRWNPSDTENTAVELFDANGHFLRRIDGSSIKVSDGICSASIKEEEAVWARLVVSASDQERLMVLRNWTGEWPSSTLAYKDPLEGRKVLFAGDSITNAIKDSGGRSGWAGRIGEDHKMNWLNKGISGVSVGTCRGGRVIHQLDASPYKYVILHGGVNDAMDSAPVGEITEGFDLSALDTSTFAGGLEELFATAKAKYPDAAIGFLINYATPNSTWGGRTKDMSEYFEVAKAICDKWDIPYLDLYSGTVHENGELRSYSYDILEMDKAVSLWNKDAGEVHVGGEGYDRISPYIANWMQSLRLDLPESADSEVVEGVRKELLEQAVRTAEVLVSEGALENLNPVAARYFNAALDKAKEVLQDPSADQNTVNEAWKDLSRAIQMLNFKSDKTELKSLIAQAEAVDRSKFDAESLARLDEALRFAREVDESETALDEQSIQEAVSQLRTALDSLNPAEVLDYSVLQMLVDAVADTDLSLYVPAGQPEFTAALDHANTVLTGAESQMQIDSAVTELNNAWLSLRLKPSESMLAALQSFVDQVNSLDPAAYTAATWNQIEALKHEVTAALADENTDSEKAEKLIAKVADVQMLIDHPDGKQSANKADQKNSVQAGSVKTGLFASLPLAGTILSGAAFAALRRRKRK